MKIKLISGLCIACSLSACASYPQLYTTAAVPPANAQNMTELDHVLADAVTLQQSYSTGYQQSAKAADLGQLPLIGAAAAAAWILLDDKKNAATIAGKIGIGAGAYSAARGQFTAVGMPEAYIAGHAALTCVLSEGGMFAGAGAAARYTALDNALVGFADSIKLLQLRMAVLPNGSPTADEKAMLTATRALGDQAITQARAAEQSSLAQEGAYNDAARVFRNAVAAISARVASRGRVRPAIDYATLRDSFAAAPKKSDIVGSGQADGDASSIIQGITRATSTLLSDTARLSATTPHYIESLARVAACPSSMG